MESRSYDITHGLEENIITIDLLTLIDVFLLKDCLFFPTPNGRCLPGCIGQVQCARSPEVGENVAILWLWALKRPKTAFATVLCCVLWRIERTGDHMVRE